MSLEQLKNKKSDPGNLVLIGMVLSAGGGMMYDVNLGFAILGLEFFAIGLALICSR